jgi:hypothetical protein
MCAANAHAQVVPIAPFLYVSTLWPLVHVVVTARAIETAAVQRRTEAEGGFQDGAQQQRVSAHQRLPRWAAATFLVLAVFACWTPRLLGGSRDRYPFSNGDACRPCSCSGEAVLESCDIPATLGVLFLYLDGRGIRGITPDTFRSTSILATLDLSHNNVSALAVGAFGGLGRLQSLDLSANAMGTLGTGVFQSVPTLTTLILRDTPLTALRAGALAGLDQLLNLFLDSSYELHTVEPGSFADTPRLANVWVGGSALNCSRLGLSGGVTCLDDVYCDMEHIVRVGNGRCDGGEYDVAICAWDGGDCA